MVHYQYAHTSVEGQELHVFQILSGDSNPSVLGNLYPMLLDQHDIDRKDVIIISSDRTRYSEPSPVSSKLYSKLSAEDLSKLTWLEGALKY